MKTWMAWGLLAVYLLLAGGALVFTRLSGTAASVVRLNIPIALTAQTALVAVGLLIVSRRSRNLIGWLLLQIAVSIALFLFSSAYARYALVARPGALPGGLAFAWLTTWVWVLYLWPVSIFLPLLFPTGRLPSPRWKGVAWLAGAQMAVMALVSAFRPGPLPDFEAFRNPLGLGRDGGFFEALVMVISLSLGPLVLLAAASLLLRFSRARGAERAQIKWFLYVAVLFGLYATFGILSDAGIVPSLPPVVGSAFFGLFLVLFALAIGVAVLQYRLYDIDVVIRRTLVYGALTAALAFIYFASVVILQALFRVLTGEAQSQLVTVLSTLAIAAAFSPLRQRVQGVIDRRFYRQRYDAARTLAAFAAAARDETNLDRLIARLAEAVAESLQPDKVSVWLNSGTDQARADETRPEAGPRMTATR